jgi:hypothetical protein
MWILEGDQPWWHHVVEADYWLRSLNGVAWVPGERMESVCPSPGLGRVLNHGEAPESRCHCGVYAFHSIDQLMPMLHEPFFTGPVLGPVLGEVSLWGKIVVHQDGYRARYAYPRRLWVDESFPEELKRTLRTYVVPVATTQDVEFRRLVETRVDSMEPVMKDAAVAFLTGTGWLPPWCCPVCRNPMLPLNVCSRCDPEAAKRELDRLYEEMRREIREKRRQRFPWLYAPMHSIDIPPRLNSEVDMAKLRAFAMAGALTAALATLLTHPPQSL